MDLRARAGAPRDSSTRDRFGQNPFVTGKPLVRAEWFTPVEGWDLAAERALPAAGKAIWRFPEGELHYIDLRFAARDIAFDVPPIA